LVDPSLPLISQEDVRVRNPKTDDIGDVICDTSTLENQYLYDEKEIYLQIIDKEKTVDSTGEISQHNAYHIMIREFNPETWQLGPIYEVKVDRNATASKFSQLVSERLYPHINPDNLFFSKVSQSQIKNFKRSDLVLRRWSRLRNQSTWLG
jgi:ABC-type Fe3+/spermidine/putrescine transport system ATPase subunit